MNFGFEVWILVLIASVPDLCILFTYTGVNVISVYEKFQFHLPLYGFLEDF